MSRQALDLVVQADLKRLRSEIGKLPKEFQKQAHQSVSALEKELVKAEQASKRAGKAVSADMGKAAKQAKSDIGGLKDTIDALGGSGSAALGPIEKFAKGIGGLAGAGGPAGVAIGIVAAAASGLALAGIDAAKSMADTVAELERLNRTDGLTDRHRELAQQNAVALREVDVAVKMLSLELGTVFSPVLQEVSAAMLLAAQGATTLAGAWEQARAASEGARRVLTAIGTLGMSEVIGAQTSAVREQSNAVAELEERWRATAREIDAFAQEQTEWAKQDAAITAAQIEGQKAAAQAAKDRAAAAAKAAAEQAAAERAALAEQVAALQAAQAEGDRVRNLSLNATKANSADIQQQIIDANTIAFQELDELAAEAERKIERTKEIALGLASVVQSSAMQMAAALSALSAQQIAEAEMALEAERSAEAERRARQIERIERRLHEGEINAEEAKKERARIRAESKARRQAERDRLDQARKVGMRLFAGEKTAAITGIVMQTALAAMKAAAELGPVAGPIAAGIIAATGAAQIAVVASQKPPQFHVGGVNEFAAPPPRLSPGPDDMLATLRAGEGVLTPRAVAAVGGPAGVDAMNRGEGSVARPVVVNVHLQMPDGQVATSTSTTPATGGTVYQVLRSAPGRRPEGR